MPAKCSVTRSKVAADHESYCSAQPSVTFLALLLLMCCGCCGVVGQNLFIAEQTLVGTPASVDSVDPSENRKN